LKIKALDDFAYVDGWIYSVYPLTILMTTGSMCMRTRDEVGDEVMKRVRDFLLIEERYTEIIIVFQGQEDHSYSHAACFVRGPDYKG